MSDAEEQLRRWVERLVIGERLCPFASAPWATGRVRIAVCEAADDDGIYRAFLEEVERLLATDPAELETTLLAVPDALGDFADYLDMLAVLEQALAEAGLEGVLQIASFHPDYRFADEAADDHSHWTNRAPVPVFHLLREDSIGRAVASLEDPDAIPRRNRERMRELGIARLRALRDGREPG
ncbi:DUF1415 domain-containing protein [endosymbiont of unidentified scaly snail isolate Monju]|uniref:DUF1415 domain-containing protein n=1 Tax=endosymbiont of unidentified scaly snail isolate Monju TaxID=1248727 RepID=UPI0003891F10|nr:DUF1415 domain-containing protein [endosymbiont of unidentified scaly snail isolate Monju]BAN69974.1 conserved hypothetical protein [endosymbiont of unidentified scaly snail isolate Monju]